MLHTWLSGQHQFHGREFTQDVLTRELIFGKILATIMWDISKLHPKWWEKCSTWHSILQFFMHVLLNWKFLENCVYFLSVLFWSGALQRKIRQLYQLNRSPKYERASVLQTNVHTIKHRVWIVINGI
jgi:hypothetical protein